MNRNLWPIGRHGGLLFSVGRILPVFFAAQLTDCNNLNSVRTMQFSLWNCYKGSSNLEKFLISYVRLIDGVFDRINAEEMLLFSFVVPLNYFQSDDKARPEVA